MEEQFSKQACEDQGHVTLRTNEQLSSGEMLPKIHAQRERQGERELFLTELAIPFQDRELKAEPWLAMAFVA